MHTSLLKIKNFLQNSLQSRSEPLRNLISRKTRTATINGRFIKIPLFSSFPPNTDIARGSLNSLAWGWKVWNEIMVPMLTGQIPAPSELLIYVRCGCKDDGCGTLTYSCKKNGNVFSYFLSNLLSVEFCFNS